jgi:exodeoxyribonuclease VII small subunit
MVKPATPTPQPEMPMEPGPAAEIAKLPFEKALAELEEIVRQLEGGRVPLEDSIAIYERGEALKKHCESLLKRAEARIERITLGPDGTPTGTAPLDPAG